MEWVTESSEYVDDMGNIALVELREIQEMWACPIRRSQVVRVNFGSDVWMSFPNMSSAEDFMTRQGWFKKFNQ